MDLKLTGKRALVTGASSGLGAAIARTLAAEGCAVIVQGRNPERTARVTAEIAATGVTAFAAIGDLTSDEQAGQISDIAEEKLGGIDILVNNAGAALRNHDNPPWHGLEPQDFIDSLNVNLLGAVRLAKRHVPGMCDRGWGRVINISTIGARKIGGQLHDYGSAKAALEHWSINLSKNLAQFKVTVNTIAPGTVRSGASTRWLQTLREQLGWTGTQEEIELRFTTEGAPQPIKRLGKPEEIAAAVAFLASPVSDYTTGAVWRIDGSETYWQAGAGDRFEFGAGRRHGQGAGGGGRFGRRAWPRYGPHREDRRRNRRGRRQGRRRHRQSQPG
jgi:NAD(P)-dependent dehydrogenase (short-subunit alcohol dehydrogenase family)